MNKKSLLTVVLAAIFVLYPLLVYFGLQHFGPRLIAGFLLCLLVLRLLLGASGDGGNQQPVWIYVAASLALVGALVAGSSLSLKLYPVLVNASFLAVFAFSLVYPPSVIEKLARLREPDLPAEGVSYTRKVTIIWCVFFVANGTIALLTVFASDKVWALYNGLISYVCMAVLLGGEWLVRKRMLSGRGVR